MRSNTATGDFRDCGAEDREPGIFAKRGEGRQRTIAVVGAYTAGVRGAMDFFTSVEALRDLRKRMTGKFPAAYQVIVTTSMDKMLPLSD